jgi:plasmid stabilization system protein ParE
MNFAVRVLHRAQIDADLILRWISERSPECAIRWSQVYDKSLLDRRRDANEHKLAPESMELNIELRQKFFKTRRGRSYRLIYTIIENEVRVLRVRGPGQAPIPEDDIRQ